MVDGLLIKIIQFALTMFILWICAAQRPMQVTKDERIAALEAEMAALNARTMTTTAAAYGIQR